MSAVDAAEALRAMVASMQDALPRHDDDAVRVSAVESPRFNSKVTLYFAGSQRERSERERCS